MVAEDRSSRPPSSTTTWSLTRSSSPSRCEVTSTAMPNSWPTLLHQRQHVVAGGRVEAVGRLVEQHQPRVVRQRLGQLGPLLHAGRVAAHRPVPLLGQPHVAQHVGRPLPRRVVGQAGHLAHVHHEVAGATRRPAGSRARACSRPARGSPHRRCAMSWPSTVAVPAGRGTSPSRILISVDLPAPLAPTRPVTPVTDGDVEVVERGDRRILLRQSHGLDHGHRFNLDGVRAPASYPGLRVRVFGRSPAPLTSDHEQTGRRNRVRRARAARGARARPGGARRRAGARRGAGDRGERLGREVLQRHRGRRPRQAPDPARRRVRRRGARRRPPGRATR